MPETRRSTTNDLPFAEVIARLGRHDAVDGLIVIGSARSDEMSPSSDYDLVVVLSPMRVPLHVGITYIDGRIADLIFHTVAQVEQFLAADAPLDFGSWKGRLVGWLETGDIVFDRRGRLRAAQAKARNGSWIRKDGDNNALSAWNNVNYNLQVIRRCLLSDDPLYLATADIRMMLYGPPDLFFNYFAVRGIRWRGEKSAIQHLQQDDPGYLALFSRFLAESDRTEKFRLYEELAVETIAPVGQLWQDGDTVMMVDAEDVTPQLEQQALDFWQELVCERCPQTINRPWPSSSPNRPGTSAGLD